MMNTYVYQRLTYGNAPVSDTGYELNHNWILPGIDIARCRKGEFLFAFFASLA